MYVAFGVCILFFIVGIAGILWAFKNGDFEDMEGSKFDMLDDDVEGTVASRARAAVEKARLKAQRSGGGTATLQEEVSNG